MRVLGRVLLGLLALVFLLVGGVFAGSAAKIRGKVQVPSRSIALASDSVALARGHKLATAVGKCQECHGQDFSGRAMIQDKKFAWLIAPNLSGGTGSRVGSWTPDQFDAAIRHGVGPGGQKLAFMPAEAYQYLTDADVGALVAYLKSLPRVDNTPPGTTSFGPIARALLVTGKLPLFAADVVAHDSVGVRTMPEGAYLAYSGGCHSCHHPDLEGGPIAGGPPDAPPAPDISATGLPGWTEADFLRAMRTGMRPDGTTINPFMPWALTGQLTDAELAAIWQHLRSVGA